MLYKACNPKGWILTADPIKKEKGEEPPSVIHQFLCIFGECFESSLFIDSQPAKGEQSITPELKVLGQQLLPPGAPENELPFIFAHFPFLSTVFQSTVPPVHCS